MTKGNWWKLYLITITLTIPTVFLMPGIYKSVNAFYIRPGFFDLSYSLIDALCFIVIGLMVGGIEFLVLAGLIFCMKRKLFKIGVIAVMIIHLYMTALMYAFISIMHIT